MDEEDVVKVTNESDESNVASDEEDNISRNEDEESSVTPEQKHQVGSKIYARDGDGLIYESVVRRAMYGPQYRKQVQMGMTLSMEEADNQVEQASTEEPCWHYFVHFSGWNVKFDRFVTEEDCLVINEASTALMQRVKEEHALLRKSMMRKVKGKKGFQTINGAAFLQAWRKKLDVINEEAKQAADLSDMKKGKKAENTSKKSQNTKSRVWTGELIEKELKLRSKGLTNKRSTQDASRVAIPVPLKKLLVEQWELVCQCGMVASIPSPVSVRAALNEYLKSKGIVVADPPERMANEEQKNTHMPDAEASEQNESAIMPAETIESKDSRQATDTTITSKEGDTDEEGRAFQQEWIDMADGMALMFDEAIPTTLLYEEEIPQLRALEADPAFHDKRYSEFYGCGHLLRLFVRLSPLLAESLPEEEARPVIGKVNDFLRFLHKNQSSYFSHSYRRMNEAELKMKQKLEKNAERKRARLAETIPTH